MSQDNLEIVQAVVCPNCASLNYLNSNYCSSCGHKLSDEETSDTSSTNCASQVPHLPGDGAESYTHNYECGHNHQFDPDFLSLLGAENCNYYLEKFSLLEEAGKETSWNWAAFIFGPLWGIYRRLYVHAGISIAVMVVVTELFNQSGIINLSIVLAWGLLGTSLYKKELEKKVETVKTMSEPLRSQYIKSNSGTIF